MKKEKKCRFFSGCAVVDGVVISRVSREDSGRFWENAPFFPYPNFDPAKPHVIYPLARQADKWI